MSLTNGFVQGLGNTWDRVKSWAGERNAPQIGPSPYQPQWGSLLEQLTATANGQGPSVAAGAYDQAHGQAVRDQMTMAAGGSAGAARQAGMNIGRANQGLAQGMSQARLQEQLASRMALQSALTGAGNAWFQPQGANLQAQMATPTNGQMLTNFLMQLGQMGGMLAGK